MCTGLWHSQDRRGGGSGTLLLLGCPASSKISLPECLLRHWLLVFSLCQILLQNIGAEVPSLLNNKQEKKFRFLNIFINTHLFSNDHSHTAIYLYTHNCCPDCYICTTGFECKICEDHSHTAFTSIATLLLHWWHIYTTDFIFKLSFT